MAGGDSIRDGASTGSGNGNPTGSGTGGGTGSDNECKMRTSTPDKKRGIAGVNCRTLSDNERSSRQPLPSTSCRPDGPTTAGAPTHSVGRIRNVIVHAQNFESIQDNPPEESIASSLIKSKELPPNNGLRSSACSSRDPVALKASSTCDELASSPAGNDRRERCCCVLRQPPAM